MKQREDAATREATRLIDSVPARGAFVTLPTGPPSRSRSPAEETHTAAPPWAPSSRVHVGQSLSAHARACLTHALSVSCP